MILVGSTESRAIDRPDGSFLDYSVDDRFLYINISDGVEYFHLNEAKPTPPRHRIPQYNTGK